MFLSVSDIVDKALGYKRSSASTNKIYSPLAMFRPLFRAIATPWFVLEYIMCIFSM